MDDEIVKKSPPAPAKKPQKESVSYTRTSDQGPIGNIADRMRGIFSNRTTAILAFVILVIGVSAGTVAVQRSTETRQRAAAIISPQGPCYPLGDVNLDGKVDATDSQRILAFVAGTISGTFNQQNADVDRDGRVTSVDSQKILRYVAGLDTTFAGCPTISPTPTRTPTTIPTPSKTPTSIPTPTPPLNSSITGHVFMDIGGGTNLPHAGNGIRESEETGKSSVTVTLNTGATRTTGADGSFSFSGLPTGNYTVTTSVPANNIISPGSTTSKTVSLSSASQNGTVDSGIINLETPPCYLPASILTQINLPTNTVRGYGDVDNDGKVTAIDALKILRYVAVIETPGPVNIEAGDTNGAPGTLSTAVDSVDALNILRFVAYLPITGAPANSFPVCAAQPTPTPVPTTPTKTPTPTPVPPTPTPPSTGILPQGPCYPLGDTNLDGKVDIVDSQRILAFVAGTITGTFNQQNADVDRDGRITSADALKIARYIAGLETTFSGCGIAVSTPTPVPATPTPVVGDPADINRDGKVDLVDFNLWLRAFQKVDNPPYSADGKPYYPDANNSGAPELLDFNIWLAAYQK